MAAGDVTVIGPYNPDAAGMALMDTALRTPKSGYLYRRLANALQDIKIEYDNTVRDANKSIIQFKYGDDDIDVSKSDGGIIDVDRMIDNLPKNNYYNQDGILRGTVLSPGLEKTIILAFRETLITGLNKVCPESLFLAIIRDESFEKYFKDRNIEIEDARNTVQQSVCP